jgi:hypothetical protein
VQIPDVDISFCSFDPEGSQIFLGMGKIGRSTLRSELQEKATSTITEWMLVLAKFGVQ